MNNSSNIDIYTTTRHDLSFDQETEIVAFLTEGM